MCSQIGSDKTRRIDNVCESGYCSNGTMKSCDNSTWMHQQSFVKDLSLKDSSINNLDRSNRANSLPEMQISPEWYYQQNDEGDTPLHIMIITKRSDHAFWLISVAPTVNHLNMINDASQTALHLAAMSEQPQVARRLVLMGAKITCRTYEGNTPLHLACLCGDAESVRAITSPITMGEKQWILSQGRPVPAVSHDLEVVNHEGYTCLHLAVSKGNIEIVAQLLNAGANANSRESRSGRTALHLAVEKNNRDIVHLIAQQRPDCLNQLTYGQISAYQMALDVDANLAQDLLRFGASSMLRYSSSSESSSESSSDESSSDDEGDNNYMPLMGAIKAGQNATCISA